MRKSGISTVLTNILWTCLFERTLKSNDTSSFWPPKIAINQSLCANIHDSFRINHRVSCEKNMARIPLVDGNIWHPGYPPVNNPICGWSRKKPSIQWRLESCSFRWLVSKHVPAEKQHYISFKHQVAVEKSQWAPGHFIVCFGANELVYPRYMGYTWRRISHLLNG